jgi:maltose O-acetyltransferase
MGRPALSAETIQRASMSRRQVKARKTLALLGYYVFATHLPDRSFPCGRRFGHVREALCRRLLASCGEDIDVGSRVFLGDGQHVRLGNRSGVGSGSRVYGANIGDDVICGRDVVFLKENHRYDDTKVPIRAQGLAEPRVPVIGDGAWIGERAIILPGRRVGSGAIVGAGAVVARDVRPFEIVGGNPARPIGHRRGMQAGSNGAIRHISEVRDRVAR